MARNGSGTFSVLAPIAVANTTSSSTTANATIDDMATALTESINKDGTKAWAANQSVGGFKFTSLANGSAATDSATLSQVQNGVVSHSTAVAGTADAIQVTLSPASTSLTTNERIRWKSGGANTVTTPTLSKDGGSTNKTIKKGASAALAVGDTGASGYECEAVYNGTDWLLINPAGTIGAASDTTAGIVELATTAEAIAGTDTVRAVTPAGLAAYLPPGSMVMYGAAAAPSGWLLCDGAAVSRATYAALFTAISTSYGVGDNSTTFNVPDLKSRAPIGYGTGSIVETQAAANWATTDIITVSSNTQAGKPKLETGMMGQVTSDGTKPTGISLATNYFVRRLSATTISLYDTFAHAIDTSSTTGIVDITNIGSGNHTLTVLLQARALGDKFGSELNADVPAHDHLIANLATGSGFASDNTVDGATPSDRTSTTGDTSGITNMPPSAVVNFIIKT